MNHAARDHWSIASNVRRIRTLRGDVGRQLACRKKCNVFSTCGSFPNGPLVLQFTVMQGTIFRVETELTANDSMRLQLGAK